MNCLEFRRRMTIDPMAEDDDLRVHEEGCPDCATFARKIRADEVKLRAMLKAVQPPEGLAERVKLAAGLEQQAVYHRRWWYSAAAGVLLTIGVFISSLFVTVVERGNVALAQSVLYHIEDEASHLRESGLVSKGRVKFVFHRFGAELTSDIGPVRFAAECLMRQRNGVHLVLPGQAGPITVFFMPGEMTDSEMPIDSPRFEGELIPTDWGSIAVVGEQGESLDGIAQRMAEAVNWPAEGLAGSVSVGGGLVGRTALVAQQ